MISGREKIGRTAEITHDERKFANVHSFTTRRERDVSRKSLGGREAAPLHALDAAKVKRKRRGDPAATRS